MTLYQRILITAIPGLMLGIIPAQGISLRFSWQLVSIWLAAAVFTAHLLRSWWLRLFFVLCTIPVLRYGPIATSYLTLLTIAVFLVATEGFRDTAEADIYDAMTAAAGLLLIWGLMQLAGLTRYFPPLSALNNLGPFNINEASAFFAMCLPVFFSTEKITLWRKHSLPGVSLLGLPIAGILISRSTTGFMAAVAACFVYLLFGPRKLWRLRASITLISMFAAALIFFITIDPPGKKDMVRLDIWKHTVWSYRSEMFGRGLGSFEQLFPVMVMSDTDLIKKTGGGWIIHAHNEYLQVGFEIGIPALGLILVFLGATYSRAWHRRESLTEHEIIALSGLAATAVAAAGFHTFHVAPTALLGCVWVGRALKGRVKGLLRVKGQGYRV
jgi:O-antigen ligase